MVLLNIKKTLHYINVSGRYKPGAFQIAKVCNFCNFGLVHGIGIIAVRENELVCTVEMHTSSFSHTTIMPIPIPD